MPHVIVKMYEGRSVEEKRRIADAVTRAIVEAAGSSEAAVSVGIEDVAPRDWTAHVYEPDIVARSQTIYKQPGYDPR